MVAVNAKMFNLGRVLRTDAAQRLIVLDATREGTKVLLQTGGAHRAAIPAFPPAPARPVPQIVARSIDMQAGLRPAGPVFGDAAQAYDQVSDELMLLADLDGDDLARPAQPGRGDAAMRDGAAFAPARGEAQQQTAANAPGLAQGLAAPGVARARRAVDQDNDASPRNWSLRWWNPGVPGQAAPKPEQVALRKRLFIAFAVILAGLAIAAML